MTTPRMTNLFRQLGLDSSAQGVALFIEQHQLPLDIDILEAPFWTPGQQQFLREQLEEDTSWSIIVDQLNESLHEDAAKAAANK